MLIWGIIFLCSSPWGKSTLNHLAAPHCPSGMIGLRLRSCGPPGSPQLLCDWQSGELRQSKKFWGTHKTQGSQFPSNSLGMFELIQSDNFSLREQPVHSRFVTWQNISYGRNSRGSSSKHRKFGDSIHIDAWKSGHGLQSKWCMSLIRYCCKYSRGAL